MGIGSELRLYHLTTVKRWLFYCWAAVEFGLPGISVNSEPVSSSPHKVWVFPFSQCALTAKWPQVPLREGLTEDLWHVFMAMVQAPFSQGDLGSSSIKGLWVCEFTSVWKQWEADFPMLQFESGFWLLDVEFFLSYRLSNILVGYLSILFLGASWSILSVHPCCLLC